MKKIILIIGLVIVVLIVAGVVVVGSHLGEIIKAGMESAGPKITQTPLTVGSVNVSLLGGSAGVQGLVVGNPEGFSTPHAISIGKAAISLVPSSIMSDKVVIRSVELRDAEIIFEGDPLGANNLAKIMANVKAASGTAVKTDTNAPANPPAGNAAGKKLEVDDFLIAGAKVQAKITGLVKKDLSVTLPDIHLTDLGKGGDGITGAELTQKILAQINTEAVKAIIAATAQFGKEAAQEAANAALTNANKAAADSLDKLMKKKGLGGLLGK